MNKLIPVLALMTSTAWAGSLDGTCTIESCLPGDKATTHATPAEPYFACPTRELADYTDIAIGMMAVMMELTGHFPNISDTTGDAEFPPDANGQPNVAQVMLDNSRAAAHVRTFDQAVAQCERGRAGLKVTILNNPHPGKASAIWVMNDKTQQSFWMTSSALAKR